MKTRFFAALILSAISCPVAWSQPSLLPSAASTKLYFAQLADGGPASQKWAVTLILTNPGTVASSVTATFLDNNGNNLALDFGQGPTATLTASIPAGGTVTFTSLGNSSQTTATVGWATVTATNPVSGTVLYRATNNGTPVWDVAAAGTGPTFLYDSYANPNLGIALVNPSSTNTVDMLIAVNDTQGNSVSTNPLTLTPMQHMSFNLSTEIPGLPATFVGSISIAATDNPPQPFVAWALNSRTNLLSPLPPGQLLFPSSYSIRGNDVFAETMSAMQTLFATPGLTLGSNSISNLPSVIQFLGAMKLSISSNSTPTASFTVTGSGVSPVGIINVSTGMLEALGDSRSGLSFLLSHVFIYDLLNLSTATTAQSQSAADLISELTLLQAGYDPGGSAALIGILNLAQLNGYSVDPAILNEFTIPGGWEARAQALSTAMQAGCGTAALQPICQASHGYWHAGYPAQLP